MAEEHHQLLLGTSPGSTPPSRLRGHARLPEGSTPDRLARYPPIIMQPPEHVWQAFLDLPYAACLVKSLLAHASQKA